MYDSNQYTEWFENLRADIYGVKSFLQIEENRSGQQTKIKACQYFICQIWNVSVCWVVLAKSRLVSVENVVLREIIHSLVVYYFFYNFGDWPKIFRICLSTFFIQRFQLCYFIIFRKVREFDGYIVNLGYRHG